MYAFVWYSFCTVYDSLLLLALLKVTGIIEQATYTGLVGKEIKRETKTTKGIQ